MLTFEQLLAHFEAQPKRAGAGYVVKCPAHEDRQASLSVTESDDKFLLYCHAGCTFESVLAAAKLSAKDLSKSSTPRVICTYDYRDEKGQLIYQVQRWEPKSFTQRRPNGTGWINSVPTASRIPYRLPELLKAKTVLIVEGEKDVETLRRHGFEATTTGGATSWRPDYAKYFKDKLIFIIADADEPGRKYAATVALALHQANSVSVLEMPKGKDVSDWFAAGGTHDQLNTILSRVKPWRHPDDIDIADDVGLHLVDMPEAVLMGRLGEILKRRMARFPIAYAWPALVTVAGTMTKRAQGNLRQNLYCALVGPLHSGKSQAIETAIGVLGLGTPELQNVMSGSAEGLLGKLKDANGCARLVSVDEIGHLLSKAHIENASFPYVLNRAFYATSFDVTGAKGKQTMFCCEMSILGGCPDDQFDQLFDLNTVGGLYDRFIFGVCPQPFTFDYRPFEGITEHIDSVSVGVDPEVWETKRVWVSEGIEPRCAENALRVAGICASVDGETLLQPAHLGPAKEFAQYLTRARQLLKPNPGENADAKCAFAILSTLERLASNGSRGKWVSRRDIYRQIHASRLGPNVFKRAAEALVFNGDAESHTLGKKVYFRLMEEN